MGNIFKAVLVAIAFFVMSCGKYGNCTPSNKQVGTYTISGNTILVKYGYNSNTNAEPKITISGKKLTLSEYKKGNTGKETPLIKVFVRR